MASQANQLRVIITGATGMVGEGVLLECLDNPGISQVLLISRKHYDLTHPKLTELLVPDLSDLSSISEQLSGYDACFYGAGITSNGMTEADYTRVTYDTPLAFATQLAALNPSMVLAHVSGRSTDSTEKGRIMWARVKGKAENALMKLHFRAVYNFRPGFMKPTPGQKNIKGLYKALSFLAPVFIGLGLGTTLRELALAMIHSVTEGYPTRILEISDIKELARI